MRDVSIAVVGATGAVGREMIATLERRAFPVGSLRLMASERSAGSTVPTAWGDIVVEDLATADPTGIEIALFSAGGSRSKEYAPKFTAKGVTVVDNSSAWRMDPAVPLVVADVNDAAVHGHEGIIANPNCTTMVLLMGLGPIHRAAGLTDLVATSYQSVSGSGQQGMATLLSELGHFGDDHDALKDGTWAPPDTGLYARPIAWNVLPLAGAYVEHGYTDEEMKLVNETRKILDAPDVRVEPTCVRVPVMVSHGIAATAWFERDVTVEEVTGLLAAAPGVELWTDTVPTPLDAAGRDATLVGRIRPTVGRAGGISFWVVGDNLRKGAALNTVQIAELLVA